MTEAEWLQERLRSQRMVWFLRELGKVTRTKAGRRKLRLFACGCCRLVWKMLQDPRSRNAVEVAERFAEGQATKEELEVAAHQARELGAGMLEPEAAGVMVRTAAAMAADTARSQAFSAAFYMTVYPVPLAGYKAGDLDAEALLCSLGRCVFGNPFRPMPAIDPAWASWHDGTVRELARTIYDERRFERMRVLADALEEAGCTNAEILGHCRHSGPHIRGCWVVDLLLGKS